LISGRDAIIFIEPELRIYRLLLIWAIAVLLGLTAHKAFAQSFNVVSVEVKGNKAASTSLILSVAGIKPGDQLSSSTTQDAVRRLYGLQFFQDVAIEAEEVTGGIAITIKVRELPRLSGIEFDGNSRIKTKDLLEKLKIEPGAYLSPQLVFDKKNEIINLYGEKGFFLARATPRLTYSADSSEVALKYDIEEGSKVKVENVVLTGNVRVPAKDIISKMRNRKRGFLKSSNFDKEKYPEDKDKIIEYLHKEGYVDAYLKSDSIAIDTARNRMTIFLDIHEGPRYYFGKTEWKGNEVFADRELQRVLKFKEGAVFNQEKYDESTYEVYYLYQEKGYLHIRLIDDLRTRDSVIDISFDIVEGLPSEVNLVKIIGNNKTKEKVIRREMKMRPGQIYRRSLMMRSIRDIMQLNYFAKVEPDIQPLASGDVDVIMKVEEKPTGQISAGAGYSAQDKFVGTFGLGIPNFRGMGQNLNFNIDIGSRVNSYSISFTEPWLFSTPTQLGADLYYTNRRWYEDYTEGRRGGSLRIGRRLRWPDNYFRVYARYRFEGDRYYDFSSGYANNYRKLRINYYFLPGGTVPYDTTASFGDIIPGSLLDYGEDWFNASSIQLTLERDSRNLPEFATSGSILSYSFENTGKALGGYWEYQKHLFSGAKFIPVLGKLALAGKVTFGAIHAPGGDEKILEFDRFSPGGVGYLGTVRGYDDGSLTPDTGAVSTTEYNWLTFVDDTTAVLDSTTTTRRAYTANVRGKYLLVGNLELQFPIIENQLYLLAFYDIGNSWSKSGQIRMDDLYAGVGIGFRLSVPGIGTIGFDFGYPLDDRRGQTRGWKPHFQVGTTIR
jgi:outer membrane protein insertion porin family